MIWLYYLLVALVLALAGPVILLLQKKTRTGLAQKLGSVPADFASDLPEGKRIWFHAVSVGEFNAILPLLKAFKEKHSHYSIFVSTTTATAQQLAQDKVGAWAKTFYFPLDLPFCFNPWLDCIKPEVVAIAETEIWPGFSYECQRRGIELCFVNGRLSPRSFGRYSKLKAFFGPVIGRFNVIAAQSQQEAQRYLELGAKRQAVVATGNMKFDGIEPIAQSEQAQLRELLNLSNDDMVITGGSTHEGEESALLSALKSLGGKTRLILVPRHPERFEQVATLIESVGFRVRRYSRQQSFEKEGDVFLLDTIGKLTAFYSVTSVAFVGGTLVPVGGHSLIEPCAYEIPVVSGQHIFKTRDVAERLMQRQALVMVKDQSELTQQLQALIDSPAQRRMLGVNGKAFLLESRGAVERTLAALETVLHKEQQYTPTTRSVSENLAIGINGIGSKK
jgi:3-deoxy-D-manno-octulosonic-acid transferase